MNHGRTGHPPGVSLLAFEGVLWQNQHKSL
jgi:hypothetical protein